MVAVVQCAWTPYAEGQLTEVWFTTALGSFQIVFGKQPSGLTRVFLKLGV